MIMKREIGNDIVHIKYRYDVAGIKVRCREEDFYKQYDDVSLVKYAVNDWLRLNISIWRSPRHNDMYFFAAYISTFRLDCGYVFYDLTDEVYTNDLDRAIVETLKAYAELKGAKDEFKDMVLSGLSGLGQTKG